jgi:WD40 repeat protein
LNETYLADDASRLWCLSRVGKAYRIVRIDLAPEPRVTASQELKGTIKDAFHLFVTGDDPALVVAATSSPKGGWFRVFDENLALHYECRLPQAGVRFAVNRPEPLIFVTFPQTTTWQLLRQQGKEFNLVSSASYGPPRPDWFIDGHTLTDAAISPDGKLLVTSQASERPTISVWNPATGALIRQFELQGGGGYKLDVASHHTIFRLAFSGSGKYLTAADPTNAYLVDVSELTSQSGGNQAE